MKFGDIFPLLLVLLILYYAAMIAMDLYKAKLEKEAGKEKNTEEDIDISDEAASFQPIQIRRDEPKKPVPTSNDDKKSDDKNSDDKKDTATDNKSKTSQSTEAHTTHDEDKSEDIHNRKPEQASIDKPMADPFDPEAYRIPDEVLAEHRKEHPDPSESKESFSKPNTASEPQSSASTKKALRAPVMSGGFTAEELVSKVVDLSSGATTDLQNFMYKCESA